MLNRQIDHLTYALKVLIDFIIWNPNDRQSILFQNGSAHGILFLCIFAVMLRAVQLKDQFCFCAIKVNDVVVNDLLPCKANRITPKKIMTKAAFLLCHVFPKLLRQSNQCFIVH